MRTLMAEKPVEEIDARRVLFVGDTHGDLESTKLIVRRFLRRDCDVIVFLGDYVDRGYDQIGNVNYLLALKTLYPDDVLLLRGNHETPLANRYYGFLEVVYSKYSPKIYSEYSKVFSEMPFVVIANKVIVALHGGIPNPIPSISDLKTLEKGLVNVDESKPVEFQILWNDPKEFVKGFYPSYRGEGIYFFGEDVFNEFMRENDFSVMVRAHEVFGEGYKFFFGRRLLSIFSARHYGFPVKAKIVEIDEKLNIKLISVVSD